MLVYVSLCVCLLSQLHGSVDSSDNLGKNRQIHDVSNAGHFRVLRSTFGILPAAVRTILEAAHEVATKSKKYRKFVKTGTPRSARRDFEALKPVITKGQRWHDIHGVVDGFNVRMKYSDPSQGNKPSIYVFDQNGGNGVKIVYKTLDDELRELLSKSSSL